ncbi:fimbrial protein [Proteus sp. FME41]|uniref:fimbrial protein n=1 Tax=Proteus sp. FME41 TaxID=2742608 RepID=UPI001D008E62|nr:type 1 fimbrial protein [Proteus sp. FME41]
MTDTSCKVDIEGQGPNALIILPTVSTNTLSQAGQVTGRTSFNMNLYDCNFEENAVVTRAAVNAFVHGKVSAFFETGATVDQAVGRLKNMDTSPTGATFVQLQLLDGSNGFTPIKVGNTKQVTDTTYVNIKDKKATLPYAVEYYAIGETTAGKVSSSVVYTLQYK